MSAAPGRVPAQASGDDPAGDDPADVTIADLERATGLGKDLLRKWEQRYGFPQPARTGQGQRRYSRSQLERLRLVARLLEGGWRPGQLLRLPEAELRDLADRSPLRQPARPTARPPVPPGAPALAQGWLAQVAQDRPAALRQAISQALEHLGLDALVTQLVPAFLALLGEAWQSGRIEVYQEHWASHCLEDLLQGALARGRSADGRPRVLLCTPAGERHTLGLLLAECLLQGQGAMPLRLGAQLAPRDLAQAVRGLQADVVALSLSPHLPGAEAMRAVRDIHAALPPGLPLWLGGSHAALDELALRLPALRLARLDQLATAVAQWRVHAH